MCLHIVTQLQYRYIVFFKSIHIKFYLPGLRDIFEKYQMISSRGVFQYACQVDIYISIVKIICINKI